MGKSKLQVDVLCDALGHVDIVSIVERAAPALQYVEKLANSCTEQLATTLGTCSSSAAVQLERLLKQQRLDRILANSDGSAEIKLTLVAHGFQLDLETEQHGKTSWCFDFDDDVNPEMLADNIAKSLLSRFGRKRAWHPLVPQ